MRDIRVSFQKIRNILAFIPEVNVLAGIREVRHALETGLIKDPTAARYCNAQSIIQ
jgi:hypothetical protein